MKSEWVMDNSTSSQHGGCQQHDSDWPQPPIPRPGGCVQPQHSEWGSMPSQKQGGCAGNGAYCAPEGFGCGGPTQSNPVPSARFDRPVPTPSGNAPPVFQVSGCNNPTVANIIKGSYVRSSMNHGKPVYNKEGGPSSVAVLMYYWDERDGPSFSGWWFGPRIGGDQVWAYHGNTASELPPLAGWRVPWDGPEDLSLQLSQVMNSGNPQGGCGKGGLSGSLQGMQQSLGGQHQGVNGWGQQPIQDSWNAEQERQHALQEQMRRREEEQHRRQAEEEERRRRQKEREEEQRRKAEELRQRREEEEVKRKEGAAALSIRKVIQRVRVATPETYDTLRKELEDIQVKHLDDLGSMTEKVAEEAHLSLETTQKRINQMLAQRQEDERKRVELEQKRKEEALQVERVKAELVEEGSKADAKVEETKTATTGWDKGDLSPEAMVEAAASMKQTVESACDELDNIKTTMEAKWREVGECEAAWEAKRDVQDMIRKITNSHMELQALAAQANHAKEKAAKKSAALAKEAARKKEFEKHDQDSDGMLSRAEVAAFGKAEFDFELPDEVLDKIMLTLEPVDVPKYRSLFQKVAIAKSESMARERRAELERKRKLLEEQRQAIRNINEEANDALATAEKTLSSAEVDARPLALGPGALTSDELKRLSAKVLEAMSEMKTALTSASEKSKKMEEECAANEALKDYEKEWVARICQRNSRLQNRMEQIGSLAESTKEKAVRKSYAELDSKRNICVTALKVKMCEAKKSSDEYFDSVAKDGSLSKKDFVEMVKGLEGAKLELGDADLLFGHTVGADATCMPKEKWSDFVRLYMTCVKSTVMSLDVPIKSKTIRKLEHMEIFQVMDGPLKEDGAGVMRVKCLAVNDDAVGWMTIAGNQGTSFLEATGNFYACVTEAAMTDGPTIQDSKTIRKVAKGEIIEVLEFGKRDISLDIRRIKGRSRLDGSVGWITLAGNGGTVYLEQC